MGLPAYDYYSNFFDGNRWGWIRLRRYPIQSVQSVVFAYPNIDNTVFTVPPSWIRVDEPFGLVRLVPDRVAVYASFSAYILSVFSGGRGRSRLISRLRRMPRQRKTRRRPN